MSPIGDSFRNRIRTYPSLVNCCTIDWFGDSWPLDALQAVAIEFLKEVELQDNEREACVNICMSIHKEVSLLAIQYFKETSRHCYVTPTSYLELIKTFETSLAEKRHNTLMKQNRYKIGLDKLHATEIQVKHMQIEIEEMQPILIQTSKDTEKMVSIVEQEKAAETIKIGVEREEHTTQTAANAAKAIEKECKTELNKALPMLKAANKALDTLTSQDIAFIKAMKNPPKGIKIVMACLCVIKNIKPIRSTDSNTGKTSIDYWEPTKKYLLSDSKLLKSLKTYDKDNVPNHIIKEIRKYMKYPEFNLKKIKKSFLTST